jgi:Ser/Thr protein kinase RdoA (MazF antagonist)
MEKTVSRLWSDEMLRGALELFGAAPASCRLISDMENFVYESARWDGPIILRITHSSHRKIDELWGELDWMRYLSRHDVAVPQSIRSQGGRLVEGIEVEDSRFFISAFHKIDGETVIEAGACTPAVIWEWGRTMGKMHRLTKSYAPKEASWRRSAWNENDIWVNISHYLRGQPGVLQKIQHVLDQVAALPQDRDAYGLVHTDFTDVNFFLSDGQIEVFDFDDSEYHWFAYDLAVVLYDSLPWLPHPGMSAEDFRKFFWHHFYSGYTSENLLDPSWLDRLPLFMKLREMFLYGIFHKKWDLDNLTERQRNMLVAYKSNIEKNV